MTLAKYFFSFFSFGQDAVNMLRLVVNDNGLHGTLDAESQIGLVEKGDRSTRQAEKNRGRHAIQSPSTAAQPAIRESVRATLSPLSPVSQRRSMSRLSSDSGRSSVEAKRQSLDITPSQQRLSPERGRRSFDSNRSKSVSVSVNRRNDRSPMATKPQDSTDSGGYSLDQDARSSIAVQSLDGAAASASQILNRNDVFQTPTIIHPQISTSGHSPDRLRRASQDTARSPTEKAPSPRPHVEQSLHKQQLTSQETTDTEEDSEAQQGKTQQAGSSTAIQGLMSAGAYPLQRASGLAGYLKSRSKHVSNMLAAESMGYYEKVSGMWTGGRKHYGAAEGLSPDDQVHEAEDEEDATNHGERFRTHFALPHSEELYATYFASLHRVLPLYGKIYISNRHFCFRSLLPGTRTKAS